MERVIFEAMEKSIIGRKETVRLPDWEIEKITAKVDTGAYNCTIYASAVKEIQEKGQNLLEFILLAPADPGYTGKTIHTSKYKVKKVKNSFGQMEKRYLVLTTLSLGARTFSAAFTLSDRSKMKHAVLLGRKILKGRFLVDVEKTFLAGVPIIKEKQT